MRLGSCAAVLLAAALGGCATAYEVAGDPFVSPGKFVYLRCEDIAKRVAEAETRDRDLRALMNKAGNGVGGSTVNFFVYAPDLDGVEAELRLLHRTAGEKRCDPIMPQKTEIAPLH
jgi:hypothetical protein